MSVHHPHWFSRVSGSRRESVTPNQRHSLGVRADGERFSISCDGKLLFSLVDATFTEAGGVGLWTKADSVTRFDRISITPLPAAGN